MQCPSCGYVHTRPTARCFCGSELPFEPGLATATSTVPASGVSSLGSPPPPPGQAHGASRTLAFRGTGDQLFGIQILNGIQTLLTLGIYTFWGKVKVRQYLCQQTEFEGDRFEYHGTGGELFRGWIKAALIFLLPTYAATFALMMAMPGNTGVILAYALWAVAALFVIPVAVSGAWRYRLSRTSWRGIRFSCRGHASECASIMIPGMLLSLLSLGLYTPFFQVRLRHFLVGRARFGTCEFRYDGEGSDLFAKNALAMLLSIFTLGIYWNWYVAEKQRYDWQHTSFDGARFRSTVEGSELFTLAITNLLLVLFTGGLGWPWARIRQLRYTLGCVRLEGPLDLDRVQQDARDASTTGEGLADALDAAEFLDVDLGF